MAVNTALLDKAGACSTGIFAFLTTTAREPQLSIRSRSPKIIDNRRLSLYTCAMIKSFRHKGLRLLFESGNARGVKADQVARIEDILSLLSVAESMQAFSLRSLRLHPLKGDLKGFWSVTVRANWRIVFRFEAGDCYDVDLMDYH